MQLLAASQRDREGTPEDHGQHSGGDPFRVGEMSVDDLEWKTSARRHDGSPSPEGTRRRRSQAPARGGPYPSRRQMTCTASSQRRSGTVRRKAEYATPVIENGKRAP